MRTVERYQRKFNDFAVKCRPFDTWSHTANRDERFTRRRDGEMPLTMRVKESAVTLNRDVVEFRFNV